MKEQDANRVAEDGGGKGYKEEFHGFFCSMTATRARAR